MQILRERERERVPLEANPINHLGGWRDLFFFPPANSPAIFQILDSINERRNYPLRVE